MRDGWGMLWTFSGTADKICDQVPASAGMRKVTGFKRKIFFYFIIIIKLTQESKSKIKDKKAQQKLN